MKTLQEVTQWESDFEVPNHTYFVSDNREKVFAYAKRGTTEVFQFKTPYNFSTRGRKFVEVANTYGFSIADEPEPETRGVTYTVRGSGANVYTVSDDRGVWSCSCPASKWKRGDCKHVKLIREKA